MPTNFPTGSDVFNVPASPGSTALSSAGSGSRNHVQHHRDMGDAVEAMQAEATLLVHSHNSSTARHGNKLAQANTHQSPDTDAASGSLHHTLGHGATQAAPGNHASLGAFSDTHANAVSWPVGCMYISTLSSNPSGLLGGTWVQVQDAYLIGVGGSYSYSGSVVANTSTHNHTVADTGSSSDGSHTHTLSGTINVAGNHGHTNGGNTGGQDVPHSHTQTNSGFTVSTSTADSSAVGTTGGNNSHTHTSTNGPTYDPGNSNHSHTLSNYNGVGDHGHTISNPTSSQASHTHTSGSSSTAHLPTWKAFYIWRRTA